MLEYPKLHGRKPQRAAAKGGSVERRQIGALAMAVGALAVLVAVLADPLGIGGQEDKFGWKQIVLLAGGVVLALGGAVAVWAVGGGTAAGDVERGGDAEGQSPGS
jgi:hypothetical protein